MSDSDMPFEFSGINPFGETLEGKELGNYRVESLLGQGGMGTVYKAVHKTLKREVALKVLSQDVAENDPDAVSTFHREALAYARLKHPNIVKIYESGSKESQHYLALEFVSGKTFRQLKDEKGELPEEEILDIVSQLASALAAIHSKGLVHRDIKLDNVMVTPSGRVKLMDFGVVRTRVGKGALASNEIAGTFRCMAPEVIKGSPGDARADVFQMGVLIYELLTGNRFNVITGTYVEDITNEFFSNDKNELRQDVSDTLKEIVLRCLSVSPALRYQSAAVLERELSKAGRNSTDTKSRYRGEQVHVPDRVYTLNWKAISYWGLVIVLVLTGLAFVSTVVYVAKEELMNLVFKEEKQIDSTPETGATSETSAPVKQFSGADVFSVGSSAIGLSLRWDISKYEGMKLSCSWRKPDLSAGSLTWPIPSRRGTTVLSFNTRDVSNVAEVTWKLVNDTEQFKSGVTTAGFQKLISSSEKGGLRPVLLRTSESFLFAEGNKLHLFENDPLRGIELANELGVDTGFKGISSFVGTSEEAGMVYLLTGKDISVISVLKTSGEPGWVSRPFAGTGRGIAFDEEHVYTTTSSSSSSSLVAMKRTDGKLHWEQKLSSRFVTAPVMWKGNLFVGNNPSSRGEIIRYLPTVKAPVWKCSFSEEITGNMVVAGDRLFCRTNGYILGLLLLDKALPGKRKVSKSKGDFVLRTLTTASDLSLKLNSLLFVASLKEKNTLSIREVDISGTPTLKKKSLEVPETFVSSIRYLSDALRESPAPVVLDSVSAVALNSKVCFWDTVDKNKMNIFTFDSRVTALTVSHGWFIVATELGNLYRGHY